MPLYEYECNNCKYRFEKVVLRSGAQISCPVCQGNVKKLMSTFAVGAAKGAGAYPMPDLGPKMCRNC